MTKKDFELIAGAINETIKKFDSIKTDAKMHDASIISCKIVAVSIAQAIKDKNVRFDTDRFLKACFF